MEELIGLMHKQYDGNYRLVSVEPFGDELSNMRRIAEETGKYPAYFYFRKILKNGKESNKQGFIAFIFKESKKIVRI